MEPPTPASRQDEQLVDEIRTVRMTQQRYYVSDHIVVRRARGIHQQNACVVKRRYSRPPELEHMPLVVQSEEVFVTTNDRPGAHRGEMQVLGISRAGGKMDAEAVSLETQTRTVADELGRNAAAEVLVQIDDRRHLGARLVQEAADFFGMPLPKTVGRHEGIATQLGEHALHTLPVVPSGAQVQHDRPHWILRAAQNDVTRPRIFRNVCADEGIDFRSGVVRGDRTVCSSGFH
jgi:hypothetical protein